MKAAASHTDASALHTPKQPRDTQLHLQEGPYLQLLRVGGEGSHFPNGLCPPQDKGQTGQLSCDTGDIYTLQGVEADLPCLHRHGQPAIPADDRGHAHSLSRVTKRLTGRASGGLRAKKPQAELPRAAMGENPVPRARLATLALTWTLPSCGYAVFVSTQGTVERKSAWDLCVK